MRVIALRSFFVGSGAKVRKGDVVELPDDEAKYLIDFKAARIARKGNEKNFLNSDRAVCFSEGQLIMGIRKFS